MKLSSLDIRKQQFSRIVRGYDRDEVDAFLDMVGMQWQELIDDNRRSDEKVTEMQVKLEHYQKVEEALEEAIKSARDSAEKKIKDAEVSAAAILEKAEARSVKITIGAEEERLKIKRETARYSIRQKEMLTKFRSFLTSELEMLAYHEKNDILRSPDLEPNSSDEDFADMLGGEESGDLALAEVEKSTSQADDDVVESTARGKGNSSRKSSNNGKAEAETGKSPKEENVSAPDNSGSAEASADMSPEVSPEASDAESDPKSTWTVNTLVSPDSDKEPADRQMASEPDRPATPPTGEMRAAQEEIENLRKLLRDLE
jgi:cell division initiation protein